MLTLDRPLIVEGKYDKLKLSSIVDSTVITTNGFRIFNDREKRALITRLAEKNGILVLTDPDGAGLVIRNLLRGCVPKEKITNLYIPAVQGKERRKNTPSKAGYLGVEGMDADLLTSILSPYAMGGDAPKPKCAISKTDFYMLGLSGGSGSAEKRTLLAKALSLPPHMSANALLEAINLLYTIEEFLDVCRQCGIAV